MNHRENDTTQENEGKQVQQELEKQCSQLPKAQIAGKSLMD